MRFLVTGKENGGYQTQRLKEEAQKQGIQLDVFESNKFQITGSRETFQAKINGIPLEEYDLIYPLSASFTVRPHLHNILKELHLQGKIFVINSYIWNKEFHGNVNFSASLFQQFSHQLPFPNTHTLYHVESFLRIKEEITYPIIARMTDSNKGKGVHLLHSEQEALTFVKQTCAKENFGMISFREFIPNEGDLRVFVLGNKVIGAMKRIAKAGEFRNNISQGGRGELFDLSLRPDIQDMAEKLSVLSGLDVAGVDIMIHKETQKPYILEINPGPQIQGIETYTGINIAQEMITFFKQKVS